MTFRLVATALHKLADSIAGPAVAEVHAIADQLLALVPGGALAVPIVDAIAHDVTAALPTAIPAYTGTYATGYQDGWDAATAAQRAVAAQAAEVARLAAANEAEIARQADQTTVTAETPAPEASPTPPGPAPEPPAEAPTPAAATVPTTPVDVPIY